MRHRNKEGYTSTKVVRGTARNRASGPEKEIARVLVPLCSQLNGPKRGVTLDTIAPFDAFLFRPGQVPKRA